MQIDGKRDLLALLWLLLKHSLSSLSIIPEEVYYDRNSLHKAVLQHIGEGLRQFGYDDA